MAEQRDHQLLDRFRAEQDVASLECLIRRHADFVFGVCSRVLRNRQDAEDAFQATFLILVSRPPRLRRRSSLAGWLFRVAHRTAMRLARQRRRFVELDDLMAPAPEPFEEIYKQEAVLALDEELSALPERYRAPLVLCSLLGKSRHEAADELGRSEASVKASLARGKHLLRTRLLRRGILLSIAAAAGKQFIPTPVCASDQLIQLTSSLCQGGPAAHGATAHPSTEIQSIANAGVREMTSAFSAKLTATAVAVTVVAGGVLVANIDSTMPADAAGHLKTTLANASDDSLVAFEPPVARGNPNLLAETTDETLPAAQNLVPQPQPTPPNPQTPQVSVVNDEMIQGVPSPRLMYERAVEYERTRDETLIDIEYQRAMADVMQLKADAKHIEAQAMEASVQERDSILARSQEIFATAEAHEFEAEANRLSARADLLEQRLTALGAPFQPDENLPSSTLIEPGDRLTIRLNPDPDGIWGDRLVTVSPEGNITLPYVGEIPAAGLTLPEFGNRLEKYYTAGHVFEKPVFTISHSRPERSQRQIPQAAEPQSHPNDSIPEPLNLPTATEPGSPQPEATLPEPEPSNLQPFPPPIHESAPAD